MDVHDYRVLRTAVQAQASPGSRDELDELGELYRQRLSQSPLLADVAVEATDDEDGLISVTCMFADTIEGDAVVAELERLWGQDMSHPFWEAHAVENQRYSHSVRLEGATRFGPDGPYLTVRLTARSGQIPAQRVPAVES